MAASTSSALRMIRGTGTNAVTHYSCGVVAKAHDRGAKVLVMRKGKQVYVDARVVHRQDLRGVFGDTHERAGEGKYIATGSISADGKTVMGAQNVNPYLREDGAYATIIETLKKNIGTRQLSHLKATFSTSFDLGEHLLWQGKRDADGALAASEWMTAEQIWGLANELNDDLYPSLRKSKSGRRNATHKTAKEKFFGDLDVLRRATCVMDISTGEREYCGGITPYSKPLEQVGFAIDKRFLTYKVVGGEQVADYFYRLVIGRPEPHVLRYHAWARESDKSAIAYLNEQVRKAARKIA